jgi:phosphomevalonate kinase
MRIFILVLSLVAMLSCRHSSKIPDDFDYGKIENGVYNNNYFQFKIPVPENWAVQTREQVQQLQKQDGEAVSTNNSELRSTIKAADVQAAILLTVLKNKPENSLNEFNSSFIILAENVGNTVMKAGRDYLEHAKEIMKQSNLSYQFAPEYYSEKIGNRKFDAMNITLDSVQRTYYSMINRNFALSLIISYRDDQQKQELKNVINKIRFR